MTNHRLDPEKLAALQKIRANVAGISASTQRQRLQTAFEQIRRISTAEARAGLDILHPAARVQELREEGHEIQTLWTVIEYEGGDQHRVADYLWVRGAS
ncbi:helix-turn-helix domain-containing protein [Pelomonas sp. Root1444]|uniref:helix-turn-helix domain-containing protein n=1 Tax=Pelomonas sp. Root1444 TaxID=1736464 RepID=UPI000AB05F4D|nr:helix-turn-helix domain-containing protein [Pelomonas sp. Root1444]